MTERRGPLFLISGQTLHCSQLCLALFTTGWMFSAGKNHTDAKTRDVEQNDLT